MDPATLTLLISLLSDAPELIDTLKTDIADVTAGTVTVAQVATKWAAMQNVWTIAKAKWASAGTASSILSAATLPAGAAASNLPAS